MSYKTFKEEANLNIALLKEVDLPKKIKNRTTLVSTLLSLLVISGPLAFLINCFIFQNYLIWVVLGVLFLILIFNNLRLIINYEILKNEKEEVKEIKFYGRILPYSLLGDLVMILLGFLIFTLVYTIIWR